MFSAPIPATAAPRTRADARRSLVKRVALALALFALVGWFCWRIYQPTSAPTPQPPRSGLSPALRATTKVAMELGQKTSCPTSGGLGHPKSVLRKRPSGLF
jgi:hypothetical protein